MSGLIGMYCLILVCSSEYRYIGNSLMMLSNSIPMWKYLRILKYSNIAKLQKYTIMILGMWCFDRLKIFSSISEFVPMSSVFTGKLQESINS